MWRIAEWERKHRLWFSDGEPIDALRPIDNFETRAGLSSRLIVDKLGFLDLTEIPSATTVALDANGSVIESAPNINPDTKQPMDLAIQINKDTKSVIISIIPLEEPCLGEDLEYLYIHPRTPNTTIPLKPLPNPSSVDVKFLKSMIRKSYIPYQNIPPSAGGKHKTTINRLGKRFFPFTTHSFELALCIYDWTTASFVRNVLFKIFEYTPPLEDLTTRMSSTSASTSLYQLDLPSITHQIYTSNWDTYTPNDKAYMNSFMMKPASSLAEVTTQLNKVAPQVHRLSDIQNRIMGLAVSSLPRMSVYKRPVVYSGQPDMRQLSLNHFGIGFRECTCTVNPGEPLRIDVDVFLREYVVQGKILTTKAFMSFTDSKDTAMGYSNGLLLVAKPGSESAVWEGMSLVTPLAVDGQIEYTFLPGTKFQVDGVRREGVGGREIVVVELVLVSSGND
ncbi:uncharacterized protein KD926_002610 [Aspergillus affinis]|uniref:uncharacterized protein n=1 Tax=Aspergillus affinis TaxID=1070780 RepID=UPI0022FEE824|nr:uncharacterized protein KD926_002610 [Aspergillus affinis]KAI9035945.1 hypothetical protein KD926_002610 [Aspergillus affinis]